MRSVQGALAVGGAEQRRRVKRIVGDLPKDSQQLQRVEREEVRAEAEVVVPFHLRSEMAPETPTSQRKTREEEETGGHGGGVCAV